VLDNVIVNAHEIAFIVECARVVFKRGHVTLLIRVGVVHEGDGCGGEWGRDGGYVRGSGVVPGWCEGVVVHGGGRWRQGRMGEEIGVYVPNRILVNGFPVPGCRVVIATEPLEFVSALIARAIKLPELAFLVLIPDELLVLILASVEFPVLVLTSIGFPVLIFEPFLLVTHLAGSVFLAFESFRLRFPVIGLHVV
jgi:hypothetical protein